MSIPSPLDNERCELYDTLILGRNTGHCHMENLQE